MNRLLIEVSVGLALALSCYIMYDRWQAASERAKVAEAALETEKANEKIVTRYVEKKIEIVKRVPVIGRNLDRLCDERKLPGIGNPDAAAETEAGDAAPLEGLADEIADCLAESEQLKAIQEQLAPQLK